jgi:hypothetical protein
MVKLTSLPARIALPRETGHAINIQLDNFEVQENSDPGASAVLE